MEQFFDLCPAFRIQVAPIRSAFPEEAMLPPFLSRAGQ
jgi:hypothetical protein